MSKNYILTKKQLQNVFKGLEESESYEYIDNNNSTIPVIGSEVSVAGNVGGENVGQKNPTTDQHANFMAKQNYWWSKAMGARPIHYPVFTKEELERNFKEENLEEWGGRKWRPSATQRREFAKNMQDPEFTQAYYDRKNKKAEKRRATSKFDYNSVGGMYVPTKIQHDFVLTHMDLFVSPEEKEAANQVLYGYSTNEKIHHDYIHIVNEKLRGYNQFTESKKKVKIKEDVNNQELDLNDTLDSTSEQKIQIAIEIINNKLKQPQAKYQALKYILSNIDRSNITSDMKSDLRDIIINEENSLLKSHIFQIPDKVFNSLLSTYNKVKDREEYNTLDGYKRLGNIINSKGKIGYDWIRAIKHFFDTYHGDGTDYTYKFNGGDKMKEWVNMALDNARNAIKNSKEALKNAGVENAYIKTHYKNNSKIPTNSKSVKW